MGSIMDDMKRSIYIEARRLIAKEESTYICWALKCATSTMLGISENKFSEETPTLNQAFLKELFSEFFDLYDGYTWFKYDEEPGPPSFYGEYKNDPHDAWWKTNMIEARLAILDFIIANGEFGTRSNARIVFRCNSMPKDDDIVEILK